MSSNYNYNNFSLEHLNSLTPVAPPEMSEEDLARELEFWSNTQFTFEVPPGMGLLDDEFQVPQTIDTKVEDQNINVVPQPMIVQHDLTTLTDQSQAQQALHYSLFTFPTANPLVSTRLQPITIAPVTAPSNADNYTPIFPASVANAVNVNNSVILSKETQENVPSTTPSVTNITTDSMSTATTKTTSTKTVTNTITNSNNITTSNSSTNGSNRKNSSVKLNQSSNSEITQNGSAETKEGEKDPELVAKLAAEEDKRRRNTAASARFRVKKKMREQALERTAREMTAKAEMFEGRVRELEMEIKWLRSLIVEKDARLLDVERPGKRRKKSESEEDDVDEDKEKVKQEQSDQTNLKE